MVIDVGFQRGGLNDNGDISFYYPLQNGISGIAVARAIPFLMGDFNRDGAVDAADYVLWRNDRGQVGVGLPTDGNGDGLVDDLDYDLWRSHFGQTAGSGAALPSAVALSANVPEPTAIALLALAICFCGLGPRQMRPRRNR
jgi:hypothetical protein